MLARAEAASAIGSSTEATLLLKRFARSDGTGLSPGALYDQAEGLRLLSILLLDPLRTPGLAAEGSLRDPPGLNLALGSLRGVISPESSVRSLPRPDSSNSSAALTFLAALVSKLEIWSSFSFPPNRPDFVHPLVARAQVRLNSCRLHCGLASEVEERAALALRSIQGSMGRMSLDTAIGARELALARLNLNNNPDVDEAGSELASSLQVMLRVLPMGHPELDQTLRALADVSELSSDLGRSVEIKALVEDLPLLKTPADLSLALRRLFPEAQAPFFSPRLGPTLTSPMGSPHHHRSGSTARLPPLEGSITARLEEGVVLSGGSFSRLRLRDALMVSRSNSESSGPLGFVRATGRSATAGGNMPGREGAVASNPLYDRDSFKH